MSENTNHETANQMQQSQQPPPGTSLEGPLVMTTRGAMPRTSAERRSGSRILLINGLGLLALLVIGSGAFFLWHQGYYYYNTDDARVSALQAQVASVAPGTIQTVVLAQGSPVRKGQTIATLRGQSGTVPVVSPIDGTIVQEGAVLGEVLGPGQPLAQVADLSRVSIMAYVEETHIKDVHPGEGVDVKVDAVRDTTFHGVIAGIMPIAASALSAIPTGDYASGNFTKVTQRVPVEIALDGTQGHTLFPGTSASVTVHIHE